MALSKKQMLELIDKLGDDDPVDGFFTQEELDKKIKARLGKEEPKLKEASTKIAQLEAALAKSQAEIQEIVDAANNKGKSELEQMAARLEKLEKARKMLEAEKKEAIAESERTEQARQEDFLIRQLQVHLLEVGADPKSIDDAVLIARTRLASVLKTEKLEKSNGLPSSYKLKAEDPTTEEPVVLKDVLKKFIEERPSLQTPKPPGGGSESAGPAKSGTSKDHTEGMSPQQMIASGIADGEHGGF